MGLKESDKTQQLSKEAQGGQQLSMSEQPLSPLLKTGNSRPNTPRSTHHFKDFEGLVFCTFRSDANFWSPFQKRGGGEWGCAGCLVTKVTRKRPTVEAREPVIPSDPSW